MVEVGVTLSFRVRLQASFKDESSYSDVCATGDMFLPDEVKRLKKIHGLQSRGQGNPVVAYFQR